MDAVDLLLRLETQWNLVIGMGGGHYTGINYQCAWAFIDRMGYDTPARVLITQLRLLESAALPVMNEALRSTKERE